MSYLEEITLTAFDLEGCVCGRCVKDAISKRPFPKNLIYPFIVCSDCGNKRCPKAAFHENTCTNSNEPGQEGSDYPAVDWNAKPKTISELWALLDEEGEEQ